MARKKRHGSRNRKLPLAIAAPVGIAALDIGKDVMAGDKIRAIVKLTGYDIGSTTNRFKPEYLLGTYVPIALGVVVHKVANRVGVNRMIPKWLPVSI